MPDHVIALAWSPDGRHVAAAAVSGPVAVIDAATGAVRHQLPGHARGTTALAWLDAGRLASGGQDGRVRLWSAAAGQELAALEAGGWVEALARSSCGTYLAAAAGRAVRLWDGKGAFLLEMGGHPSTVTDVAWRPGVAELAAAAYGGVTFWRPGGESRHFAWKGSVLRLAWSPDGEYLATGDQDSTVHFWITATGQDLHMFGYPMKVRELAWSPDGRFLATGGGSQVTVWDCSGKGPEGTTPLSLSGHDEATTVAALAFQHHGGLLASGGGDGRVVLWRPEKGKRAQAEARLDAGVTQAGWSGDDGRLAVGTEQGEVFVYGA